MYFLSSGQRDLTKSEWDAISQGMVALPLASFDDFNAEISKLCSQVTCNYQVQAKVKAFMDRLHSAVYK